MLHDCTLHDHMAFGGAKMALVVLGANYFSLLNYKEPLHISGLEESHDKKIVVVIESRLL